MEDRDGIVMRGRALGSTIEFHPGKPRCPSAELGEYGITVNAFLPGLVDTQLTRYEVRLRESMAETGRTPPENPAPQQAWNTRAPTVPLKWAGCSPTTSPQPPSSWPRTQPLWSPARNMR